MYYSIYIPKNHARLNFNESIDIHFICEHVYVVNIQLSYCPHSYYSILNLENNFFITVQRFKLNTLYHIIKRYMATAPSVHMRKLNTSK